MVELFTKHRDAIKIFVIAPARPVIKTIFAAAILVITFVWIVVPISDQGGYRSFPGYMLMLALFGIAAVGGLTCRIEVVGETLQFVDWMTIRTIERERIDHIEGLNGVVVVTRDGQRLESVAYSRSILQSLIQSRRYANTAARIQRWVEAGATPTVRSSLQSIEPTEPVATARHANSHAGSKGITRRPRRLLTRGLPAALVATQLLGLVLWLSSPVLFPIVTSH